MINFEHVHSESLSYELVASSPPMVRGGKKPTRSQNCCCFSVSFNYFLTQSWITLCPTLPRFRLMYRSWCGPCKASKPRLKELAEDGSSGEGTIDIPVGYVLEEDLDDFLDIFVVIKSFPTYIFFRDGKEVARVEGVDFDALLKMVDENKQR